MGNKCRPLEDDEITLILNSFTGRKKDRNRLMFLVGIQCGYRVAEVVSLRVRDVAERGQIKKHVKVEAKHMKGKERSREVAIGDGLKRDLQNWLTVIGTDPDTYLFQSDQGINKKLTPRMVQYVINDLKIKLNLEGVLGTHCMRKTFADMMWEISNGNIYFVSQALGHTNIQSTVAYMPNIQKEVDAAVLKNSQRYS
jgi:integrase